MLSKRTIPSLIRQLHNAGCGADVVSSNEFRKCQIAGINPCDIVFSGVCKMPAEIDQAIAADIGATRSTEGEMWSPLALVHSTEVHS